MIQPISSVSTAVTAIISGPIGVSLRRQSIWIIRSASPQSRIFLMMDV
jgi:hypothetical protein